MKKDKLATFHLAKYAHYELLTDEFIFKHGINQSDTPEKIRRKKWSLKFRIYRTKILYATIFGILPIVPLLGYFEIADRLINSLIAIDIIIFHGSLYIGLFFTLQFFNFILMGMLEVGMITSSQSFEWLKTLPVTRNRINKIVLYTIFRSLDVPLIVIVIAFPIVMYIGTSNLIILFISIGISITNTLFSFGILVIIGCRMNRVLEVNQLNSRKAHAIRILNFIIYAVVILGSMYLIQYAFSSIDAFFIMFMNLDSPAQTNIFLSSIPYPFNPCYVILVTIVSNRAPLGLMVSSFIGFIILVLITVWVFIVALHQVKKLTFSESRSSFSKRNRKKIKVKIKTKTPFRAHVRKDIVHILHDFKTFITIITTFLLSFLFSYYFNQDNFGRNIPPETLIFTNWVGLLLISPILSALLIFTLLSYDETGQSILNSLPIIPRNQAKAKLLLIFIFQTSTVMFPNFMYITDRKFDTFFMATLGALPLIWTLLIIMFEIWVNFFGKKRNNYVAEEVHPSNKMFKWTMIMCIQYIINFWVISFTFNLYMFFNFNGMTLFWMTVSGFGLLIGIIIFLKMFPKISIASIVRRDVRNWFSLNFNHLIKTIVAQSFEKGSLLSFEESIELIWKEYFNSNPTDEERIDELEVLIDAMINGIFRVAKRIFLTKINNIQE